MTRLIPAIVFLLLLAPSQAHALAGEWQKDSDAGARLISGVNGVGQEKIVPLGLEIQLGPEWHSYWRSPGMAGLPPQIDWQTSLSNTGNLESSDLLYPAPKRYTAYGLETIGYHDHVVLPIDAHVRTPGHALVIDATLNLLVCSAICVPKTFPLKLTVPEGDATESAEAPLIKQFRDQIPGDARTSGLLLKSVVNDGENLMIMIESRNPLQDPDLFVEDDKNISFGAPQWMLSGNGRSVSFSIKPADTLPEGTKLAGMPLVLTVVDGDHALEQHVTAPPVGAEPKSDAPAPLPLAAAILFAILGGFILNLMPCVLPVLSLKILNVVSHGGGDRRTVRHSFFVTAAGIMFSYMVLAGMTIALKRLGLAFGWGVQFQQPLFLAFLILLLTFFAANMWGLLEIQLPRFLADNLDKAYHPKLAGDFAAGAFATLLATPCSAPFLGTALGFALASGPEEIVVIFAALGFGMTLPYLAIALWPRLATSLPKPGAWMMHLRHLLGWALAVTAVWLVWILTAQIPLRFAIFVGLCMVGIIILLGMRKTSVSPKIITFGLLEFVFVALAITLTGSFVPKEAAGVDDLWLPFNESAIAADIDEGKTVFVDVTASWCLTCKANMKFVLTRDPVAHRLFHTDIIAMEADWTNPNPVITEFLQKHGRYGIPFNIVYGPGAPQGIVLPELLTPSAVTDALDKAGKPKQP